MKTQQINHFVLSWQGNNGLGAVQHVRVSLAKILRPKTVPDAVSSVYEPVSYGFHKSQAVVAEDLDRTQPCCISQKDHLI